MADKEEKTVEQKPMKKELLQMDYGEYKTYLRGKLRKAKRGVK
jgi:hypothetical protein